MIKLFRIVGVSFVKALKVDVGINGEIWKYDFGGMEGLTPIGIMDAVLWNAIIAISVIYFFNIVDEKILSLVIIFALAYAFIFGFFIFPFIRSILGIKFPADNKLHFPQRVGKNA